MDGHRVAPLREALPTADVLLTATGLVEALGADDLPLLKDGVLLANAGHSDREIDVPAIAAAADDAWSLRTDVMTYRLGGRKVHVLVGGALVNIAGLDGNPIEIMDLSFSVQALSVRELAAGRLPVGVNRFPDELDSLIARTKLESLGISLDQLSAAQRRALDEWRAG